MQSPSISVAALCAALAAAGCIQPSSVATYSDETVNAELIAPASPSASVSAADVAAPPPASAAPTGSGGPPPPVTPAPEAARIAYVYRYGLELPVGVLDALYRGNARRLMNWQK